MDTFHIEKLSSKGKCFYQVCPEIRMSVAAVVHFVEGLILSAIYLELGEFRLY